MRIKNFPILGCHSPNPTLSEHICLIKLEGKHAFCLCLSTNSGQQMPREDHGEPNAGRKDQNKGEKGGCEESGSLPQSKGWFVNSKDIKRITSEMRKMGLQDYVSIFCMVLIND